MSTTPRRPRRNQSRDLIGKLSTQTGPRTTAPMWVRPLLTPGEWAIYTALWSYPADSVFPTHQDLADRAFVERSTVIDAVKKFDDLGLLERESQLREDGSTSSNTYYLIEVCTPELAAQIVAKQAERAAEQERKRKARKARNRGYAAKTPKRDADQEGPQGGSGADRTPLGSGSDGGTVQAVPPGYGEEGTSGGTVHAVPGSGVERTHETLGVKASSKGTVRTSSSLGLEAETGQKNPEEKADSPLKLSDQEPDPRDYYPELSEAETALHDELLTLRPEWRTRPIRQAIGWPSVREVAERDPELVRRAFLIGARDRARPDRGYDGTWSPLRLTTPGCPHWATAAAQLEAERAGEVVPEQVAEEDDDGAWVPPQWPGPAEADQRSWSESLAPPTTPPATATELFAKAGVRVGRARDEAEATV